MHRIEQLDMLTTHVDGVLEDLTPLLSDAERQLAEYFTHARTTYTAAAVEEGKRMLDARLVRIQSGPRFRERAFEMAEAVAREFVSQWLRRAEPDALQLFRDAVSRVISTASDAFARTAAALDVQLHPLAVDDVMHELHGRRTFYFTSLMRLTGRHPLVGLVNAVTGKGRASVVSDAEDYFVRLLETNSSRAATDIIQRLHETRVNLRQFMRRRLFELASDARKALDHARQVQRHGELAVRDELIRLDGLAQELRRWRG